VLRKAANCYMNACLKCLASLTTCQKSNPHLPKIGIVNVNDI